MSIGGFGLRSKATQHGLNILDPCVNLRTADSGVTPTGGKAKFGEWGGKAGGKTPATGFVQFAWAILPIPGRIIVY